MKFTFPLALTFLTTIPWPRLGMAGPQELARSMFWFPWVGALLGAIYWGAWWGLGEILPAPAAAALLVALTALLTGGLHLDGLADTADGLGGAHSPAERLNIMKDSRLGAFGGVALILTLLLKFAFLMSWAEKGLGGGVLLLFPVISRWGMALLAYISPYARREGGLGEAMTVWLTPKVIAGATLSALVLAFSHWLPIDIIAASCLALVFLIPLLPACATPTPCTATLNRSTLIASRRISKPCPSLPSRFSFGTYTSSRYTTDVPKPLSPMVSQGSRTVKPGEAASTIKALSPSPSRRVKRSTILSAGASDMNCFCPLTT